MTKTHPVVELFHGADWHDLTAADEVLTRDPITITHGREDAVQRVPPATIGLSIKSVDGKYNTRNPRSELFGVLTRNTPIRVSLNVAADAFGRTLSDSWGSTETTVTPWAWAWSLFTAGGAAADFDVAPGAATMVVDGTSEFRAAWLADMAIGDVDVAVTVSGTPSDVTNGHIEPANLLLRMQSIGQYYMFRVDVSNVAQAVTLQIWHENAGGILLGSAAVTGLQLEGQQLRVRAQAEGNTLRFKCWQPATEGEPFGWNLTVTDDRITSPGGVGVRSGVATGNTNIPVTFTYSNFVARSMRAFGEVESWPSRWTVDDRDVWAPIIGNGIMRRLNASGQDAPTASALFRAYTLGALVAGLLAYWPVEGAQDATTAASYVAGVPDLALSASVVPAGNQDVQVGSLPYASLQGAGPAFERIELVGWTDNDFVSWSMCARGQMPTPNTARAVMYRLAKIQFATGTLSDIEVLAYAKWTGTGWDTSFTGVDVLVTGGTGVGSVVSGAQINVFDGRPHHVQVEFIQDGADVDTVLIYDGVIIGIATSVGDTLGVPRFFHGPEYSTGSLSGTTVDNTETSLGFGHVALCNENVDDPYEASIGHAGERAAVRIERLLLEDGISVAIEGDADASARVGPQRVLPVLELCLEAADVDGGIMAEPRGHLGVSYRTRDSLYNQSPALGMSYATGDQVLPGLEPIEDTDATQNDVTVTRDGGVSARSVQATGPLNVNEPGDDPQGVGRYRREYTLNLADDTQPRNEAGWRRHMGTWPGARYPQMGANITAMTDAGHVATVLEALDVGNGDRVLIEDLADHMELGPIDQLAQGAVEEIGSHTHTIVWNGTPAGPWTVSQLEIGDGSNRERVPPAVGASIVNEALDASETALTVLSSRVRWIDSATYASMFPFDIIVGGRERMTVTAITGTTLSQTFTVTRSPDAPLTHDTGAVIALADSPAIAP